MTTATVNLVDEKRAETLTETLQSKLSNPATASDFDLYGGTRLNVEWARLASGNDLGFDYHVDQASIGVAWRF